LSNVTYEKRGTHEGIIRGQVEFVDSSVLFWREYVDVEIKEDRLMYVYQYMDSYKKLIFRYDNETYIINENYSRFRQLHGKNSKAKYLTEVHLPGPWRIGNFFEIDLDCVPAVIHSERIMKVNIAKK
jgi:hypothetical protein